MHIVYIHIFIEFIRCSAVIRKGHLVLSRMANGVFIEHTLGTVSALPYKYSEYKMFGGLCSH